jgi:fibronectin type 3 domain-containing protein
MMNYEKHLLKLFCVAAAFAFTACSIPFEDGEGKQKVDASAIPVPQNVTAQTITTSRIDLAWQADSAATSYSVYRSEEYSTYREVATVKETSYTDNSVAANTAYFYYITLSINNRGESGKSATVQADTKPPAPPATIRTSVESATKITVTWQPVAAAESYKVYRSDAPYNEYTAITATPVDTTAYSDETVSLNNDYYYKVTSINKLGEGEKSVYEIGSVQAPTVPQGLTAAPASESSIKLEWDPVSGVTGYKIYRSTTGSDGAYTEQASVTDTEWTDTGLNADIIYYYKVEAVNGIGTSNFSSAAAGKPLGTMGIPTISAGLGQLTVSWSAVAGAGEYEVYCDTGSAPTTLYATVSGTTTTITGLTNNTLYYVRLKAKNATGTSVYGGTASGKTLIASGLYDNVIDTAHKIGNQNLTSGLTYITANAVSGHNYFIVLGADEFVSGNTLSYSGKTVGITLMGTGAERIISLITNATLFTVGTGVTLTIDDNITLFGRSSNTSSLVSVSGGTLVMNDGSKITRNTAASSYGGGVSIISGGTFTMNGGAISGNTASSAYLSYGGGVYIGVGTFTMEGGAISGNTASSLGDGGSGAGGVGGGVYVGSGIFTMEGGTISGNTASLGGGVALYDGSGGAFRKGGGVNSGIIYGSETTGVDENDVLLKNIGSGAAVHQIFSVTVIKRRDTTAGQTDQINTSTGKGLSTSGLAPFGN